MLLWLAVFLMSTMCSTQHDSPCLLPYRCSGHVTLARSSAADSPCSDVCRVLAAMFCRQGALVPVLVRGLLSSHSAQRLACGMSHIAVVATQRAKANSSSGSTPVTRLLTWGKNAAGQLGIGAGREDHHMPQVGGAVQGIRSPCFHTLCPPFIAFTAGFVSVQRSSSAAHACGNAGR